MPWWVHLVLGILLFTPLSPLVIAFYILFYGVKFIVWYIKLLLHVFALIVIIPLWIVPYIFPYVIIRHVLLKLGYDIGKFSFTWAEKLAENFQGAIQVIEDKSKRTAEFTVFWGLILFIIFPIEPSLSYMVNNIRSILVITALIVGPIFVAAGIYHKIKGTSKQDVRRGAQKATNVTTPGVVKERTARTRQHIEGGAKGASKEYDKVKHGVEAGEEASKLWVLFPDALVSVLMSLMDLLPLMGSGGSLAANQAGKAGGRAAGAASKAEKGQKAAKAGSAAAKVVSLPKILIALIVGFPFAMLIILVTSSLVSGFFWAYIGLWMNTIVGPMWTAVGMGWMVGTDYAHFVDQTVVDRYAPDISFEEERLLLSEVGARANCLFSMDSVACMSEWRMNNTVQPGSDAVGQTYELEIEQFLVEGGRTIDVAGRRADLPITVRLALNNPRYGLRGVPAENITYRIGITDRSKDGYYCDTDWHTLWENSRRSGRGDDFVGNLAPGSQYQLTSVQREKDHYQENINIGSCGLLQPGQIEDVRQAELDVNYTYSSQATQRLTAMSEEHRFDNEITPSFKTSETADTPVKSFVTVIDPVTFEELESGERVSNVIDVEVGFETDDTGVDYQIDTDELRFRPSRLTKPVGANEDADVDYDDIQSPADIEQIGEQCDFKLADDAGQDRYVLELDDDATESIEVQQDPDGKDSDERWWSARSSPPTFQCSFELIDPDSISSTGETLIKDVEGEYRVGKSFTSQNFETWNTECTDQNCPLVVPEDQRQELNETDDLKSRNIAEGLISECDRSHSAEASGGCNVRPIPFDGDEFDPAGWRLISENYAREHEGASVGDTIEHETIREGEVAWTYSGLKEEIDVEMGDMEVCQHQAADTTVFGEVDHCGMPTNYDTEMEYDEIPRDWEAIGVEEGLVDDIMDDLGDGYGVAFVRDRDSVTIESHPYHLCTEIGEPDDVEDDDDTPDLDDVDFAADKSDFVDRFRTNEFSTPVLMAFDTNSRQDCEDKWDEFLDEQFDGIDSGDVNPLDPTAECHPTRLVVETGWEALQGAVGVLTGGLFGGADPPDCYESFKDTIERAGADPSDFDEDESIWVYNAETEGIMPY